MASDQMKQYADGFYLGIKTVSEYMRSKYHGFIENIINPTNRENQLIGLYLRSMAWSETITILNKPKYFQAIVSGNRALLEVCVDVALLSHDKSNSSCTKMHWWEDSAKLKAAESLIQYYTDLGRRVPSEYQAQVDYVSKNKATIKKERLNLWPNKKNIPKHPQNRWTGNNLPEDIKDVDKYFGSTIFEILGKTLMEFYRTEYPRMNWMVHGSALAGIKELSFDAFQALCALSYKLCADLTLVCIKICFVEFDLFTHNPDLKEEWSDLLNKRNSFLI